MPIREAYWNVVRFLDHPLLPANAGRDVPKIIKHGIDDSGPMHPKSPHPSAPDGVVTLLYKMGREDWLKKFIDVGGTSKFRMRINRPSWSKDLYVERNDRAVEIGLISSHRNHPSPGIRYVVANNGDWEPVAQCDVELGHWYGSDQWLRAQGEGLAKCIWYDKRWQPGDDIVEITWSGMTDAEKEEARVFIEQFKIKAPSKGYNDWDRLAMNGHKMSAAERQAELDRLTDIKRRECRGGCGVKDAKHVCSKCKEVFYCSRECQVDDWKWHKSVCGLHESDEESGTDEDSDSEDDDNEDDD